MLIIADDMEDSEDATVISRRNVLIGGVAVLASAGATAVTVAGSAKAVTSTSPTAR
jgi:hypothetical protein